MNCPSRVDPKALPNGWNQNPNPLALETNQDSNGIANRRRICDHRLSFTESPKQNIAQPREVREPSPKRSSASPEDGRSAGTFGYKKVFQIREHLQRLWMGALRLSKFVGPGFMIAVAYIDPGNYATDIAAGASYRFRLLVMVLVSNIIAIFLQSLCIRLGSVTGLNLAECCRAYFPPWLNYILWLLAEAAIVATDIAEVIGTAIALNLLLDIPVVAGCAISIVDVLLILAFYRPSGSMRDLRLFESFVTALVIGVVICFSIELSLISIPDVGEVFRGYLPSPALTQSKGLYQACGILGATVMPHSLYLGSGIVQPRLKEYDERPENDQSESLDNADSCRKYKPTLAAIRSCMSLSIVDLAISLFTFALFVNSSILIVAGASLNNTPGADTADLFDIHELLSRTLTPAAGTIFALALLISGTSAGIVATIAGQMVSEGQLNWNVRPWMRRLITRTISITPSIIIAGAVGKRGLSAALEGTQVVLSVILPFTSAPLLYFTCRNRFMTVEDGCSSERVKLRNHWIVTTVGVLLWLLIVFMNVALLVLVGLGEA